MERPDVDPRSGVRLIGEPTDYADGSEDAVLGVLESAGDRSTASDELARSIADWPTRYHLSRLRANLLRPLRLGPGMRVLDVGAGTGALTRYVAETGASVVALEGSLLRARAVAARCDGLENVEVVCGPVEAFADDDGFDVVLCVGVLEYAGASAGDLLGRLRGLTRPSGALVVAIENQLGLKYLLGYGEDHLGEPWAGVEGYPGPWAAGARTWSRTGLSDRLRAAGFGAQRWLFPFPDYKLPTTVLAGPAYGGDGSTGLVDQLVRWPCTSLASAPSRVCDDRLAHRVFLDAGLGPDVANSFLVVAGADDEAAERLVDPGCDAWFFGNDRMRLWLGAKTFRADVASEAVADTGRLPEAGWLRQVRQRRQPRIVGPTVEQLALDALDRGADAVGGVLRRWRQHLRGLEFEAKDDEAAAHPFRTAHTRRLLPDDHLDVNLSNFVADEGGSLVYVDGEWVAPGGVDADLACARSLWWFAADLVSHGVAHPWPRSSSVDELAETLGLLCDSPAGAEVVERWREAEAQLHAKVTRLPLDECRDELAHLGRARQDGPGVVRHLPFTVLRRQLAASYEHLGDTCRQLETALQHVDALTRSVQAEVEAKVASAGQLQAAQAQVAELSARLAAEAGQAASLRGALDRETGWRQALERRPAVRAYRFLRRLVRL